MEKENKTKSKAFCIAEPMTHLDDLVPTGGDNDGVHGVGGESNTRDPLGVTIVNDVELALSEGVPKLDGSVSGRRDNLSVVSGERDGENVRGVTDESLGGQTGVEVPQSESVVPGGREGELAVGRNDDVRHKVVVTVQDLLGVTVLGVRVSGELPLDDSLVCEW